MTTLLIPGVGNGVESGTLVKDVELIRAVSVAADQQPSAVDVALQIEFGVAQKTGSDPVMIDALGNVTFNQAGNYTIRITAHFGRTGASGTSLLFGRALLNGVQIFGSVAAKLASSDDLAPKPIAFNGTFSAGDVLTFEIIRDSTGSNFGGLFNTTPVAAGWNDAPTAIVTITRSEVV